MSAKDDEPLCHGCKSAFDRDEALLVSFGGRLWHAQCFCCAGCHAVIPDPDAPLLLLSDGRPVCDHCPYTCCKCHRKLSDETIYTDEVYIQPSRDDSLFGAEDTVLLLSRHLKRIWCQRCRLPDSPALPPEIIRRIIWFALPPPSPRPFDQRTAALRVYARVSRTWQALAQPQMFWWPVLAWWGQERRFLTALEGREELGEAVRTLVVGDRLSGRTVAAGPWKLGRMFELCSNVRELHLDHLEGVMVKDISKAQAIATLRCAHLSFTQTIPSPESSLSSLSLLHHLSLTSCDLTHLPSTFLTSTTLPSLRALVLRQFPARINSTPVPPASPNLLAHILPQIISLSVTTHFRLALSNDLPRATSLRLLSLPGELSADFLSHLPPASPLTFLHLPRWSDTTVLHTFDPAPLVLVIEVGETRGVLAAGATTLVVPAAWTARQELEKACRTKGLEILQQAEVVSREAEREEEPMFGAGGGGLNGVQELAVFWELVAKVESSSG